MKGKYVNSIKLLTAVLLAAGLLITGLGSCSAEKYSLHDGYYGAEAAEFDSDGWKEYAVICVSNGRIILVEYNAFNAAGFIKSWDMGYMREMNTAVGTYPSAFSRYYGGRLLLGQGTENINALSGATRSYRSFMRLADAALENARQGNTETSLVTLDEAK
jgi:major membrane immunogen (membrane-anchored lipoprotein)